MDRIEAELISHHPDILFLQEAEVANGETETALLLPRLAKALGGFEVMSANTLGLPNDQHCDVAILSRWPIDAGKAHSLEPKGWVYAVEGRIKSDNGDLCLMSIHTHATWRLNDPIHIRESTDVRRRQIREVIASASGKAQLTILGGDFNAPAGTPETATLSSGLIDLAPDDARKPTSPAIMPVLRLDYFFANQPMNVVSYKTININLSDHRPIVAVVKYPNRNPS